ncbi:heme exporter protein CcmD [Parasphingorhabdus sp. JC815]
MNHWPFVIASYAIVLLGTAGVMVASYIAMRKSEAKAEKLKRARK